MDSFFFCTFVQIYSSFMHTIIDYTVIPSLPSIRKVEHKRENVSCCSLITTCKSSIYPHPYCIIQFIHRAKKLPLAQLYSVCSLTKECSARIVV